MMLTKVGKEIIGAITFLTLFCWCVLSAILLLVHWVSKVELNGFVYMGLGVTICLIWWATWDGWQNQHDRKLFEVEKKDGEESGS